MEREEPKALELEQELDALYRKVASVDKTGKTAHPVLELKAEAAEPEEPQIRDFREIPPPTPKKEERRPRRFFRIIPVLLFLILLLCLIAVFFWPTIYHYDTLHSDGKAYPLRISRLTGESSYFDGAVWKRPPLPEAVKAPVPQSPNISAAPIAPTEAVKTPVPQSPNIPAAPIIPPEATQIKTQTANSSAAPVTEETHAKNAYAIQIKSFPENQKKEALAFMKKHKKKGLPAITMETIPIQGRGVWYRMLVGDFPTIKDASNAITKLNLDNAYPGCFVQKKSGK
jgi:hypothetical protein